MIDQIRGREVDRFLYGMEPLETVEKIRPPAHSLGSIELAGDPLAKIERLNPYSNMDELNEVRVCRISKHNEEEAVHKIHL